MVRTLSTIALSSAMGLGLIGLAQGQSPLNDPTSAQGGVQGNVIDNSSSDKPIVTPKLNFPAEARQSGSCMAKFDVNPQGEPENIQISDCTDNLYEWPSTTAVRKFRYTPKPIWRRGKTSKLSFDLANEFGIKTAVPGPVELAPAEKATVDSYGDTRKPSSSRKADNAYCCYDYSVSDRGDAFNVFVKKCSSQDMQEIFGSGYEIRNWDFNPALKNDLAVSSTGYKAILWFKDNGRKVYRGKEEDIAQHCSAP